MMTVKDIIDGLKMSESERLVVQSYHKDFGLIPIAGGYRDKVLKYAGDREIIGSRFRFDCLYLKVQFQNSDLL